MTFTGMFKSRDRTIIWNMWETNYNLLTEDAAGCDTLLEGTHIAAQTSYCAACSSRLKWYIYITLSTVGNAHIKIMEIAAHKKLLRKEVNSVINSLSHDEVMRQSHILSQKVSVDVNSRCSYHQYFAPYVCFLIHGQKYDKLCKRNWKS